MQSIGLFYPELIGSRTKCNQIIH